MKKYVLIIMFVILMGIGVEDVFGLEDGNYIISSKLDNNKVIGVSNSISSGENIELQTFKSEDTQKWKVEKIYDNYYSIVNYVDNSLSLDVSGGSTVNGSNVLLWQKHNGNNQKWIIRDAGDGYFYIISKCNNLYLDICGGSAFDGANIINWNGHGANNQKFKFFPVNSSKIEDGIYMINSILTTHSSLSVDNENIILNETNSSYNEAFNITNVGEGYYEIRSYSNDKFLGIDKTNVKLTDESVKWYFRKNVDNTYSLLNNNKCLDVIGGNSIPGTNIEIYSDIGSKAQKFYFTKVDFSKIEDGVYFISSFADSNKTIAFDNQVTINNSNIFLYNKNNTNNEKWNIKNIQDNIYEINPAINNNFSLDVASSSVYNGSNVMLYESTNTNNQRWYIVKLADGSYHITNVTSNKNLDIPGGNIKNGANIQQYENNYTDAQKFNLIKTEFTPYQQIIENGNYLLYSKINLNKSVRSNYIHDLEGSLKEQIEISYDTDGFYYLKNEDYFYTAEDNKLVLKNYNKSDNQKWYVFKDGNYFSFYSKESGKVIDIQSGNINNGTSLIVWPYNGGSNQKFYLEAISELNLDDNYYKIGLDDNLFSINSDVAYNGSNITIKADQNNDNQKWYFQNIRDNLFEIKYGLNVNKALDVSGASNLDGTNIILFTSKNSNNQKWYLIHLKNGNYKFVSMSSHTVLTIINNEAKIYSNDKNQKQEFSIVKTNGVSYGKTIEDGYYIIHSSLKKSSVLDVSGASILNGSNVILYSLNLGLNQIWKFKYLENGLYIITSALNPKRALTNYNGNVQINKYTGSENQKWYIQVLENNNMSFISAFDGNYVDVTGGSSNNGTNIQVYLGNDTNAQKFVLNKFSNKKVYRGMDISKWQGNIDFNLLARENPGFIIMRVGRGIKDLGKDVKFNEYYAKANGYDIPVGVYIYSFASNLTEAKEEANYVITWVEGRELDLPVFYDMEYSGQLYLGKEVLTEIALEFCKNIISNNYHCGLYANTYWLTNFIDAKRISENYPIWLAHWTGANDYDSAMLEQYKSGYNLSPYQYWQFTDKGKLNGITENTVDLDFGYDIFD